VTEPRPPAAALPSPVTTRGGAALVLVAAVAIYVLRVAAPLFVPVLISVLLAYGLEPIVGQIVRLRIPRLAAVVIVYSALWAGIALGGRSLAQSASSFLETLPATIVRLQESLPSLRDGRSAAAIDEVQAAATEMRRVPRPAANDGVRSIVEVPRPFSVGRYLVGAAHGAVVSAAQAAAIAILTFLLLVAGDLFKRKIVTLAGPDWSEKRLTVEVMRTIDRQIARYLIVRVEISAIVAGATAALLWPIGLDRPIAWGLVAGALNVLPFIGPTVAVALIGLAAFVQFQSAGLAAAAAGAATLVAAIEGNLLTPWLTSRAAEVNTVAIFLSVLFWGWTWDVWGLVLAVPIVVAVKAAADHIEPLQGIGELLGS